MNISPFAPAGTSASTQLYRYESSPPVEAVVGDALAGTPLAGHGTWKLTMGPSSGTGMASLQDALKAAAELTQGPGTTVAIEHGSNGYTIHPVKLAVTPVSQDGPHELGTAEAFALTPDVATMLRHGGHLVGPSYESGTVTPAAPPEGFIALVHGAETLHPFSNPYWWGLAPGAPREPAAAAT